MTDHRTKIGSLPFSCKTSGMNLVALLLACGLIFSAPNAASAQTSVINRLAGTWIENQDKSPIGPGNANLTFRLDSVGNLEQLHGAAANPLVQSIHFDEKQYPANGGKLMEAWKQIDKSQFEAKLTESGSGKPYSTARYRISSDGKSLTLNSERTTADGKKITATSTYQRTSGGPQGLAGIWKPESYHTSLPARVTYEAVGTDRFKFTNTAEGNTFTAALDGKPVSQTEGPGTIAGASIVAKQIDVNTVEISRSRDGVPTTRSTISISGDGKTMTVKAFSLAPNASPEPSITIYDKR